MNDIAQAAPTLADRIRGALTDDMASEAIAAIIADAETEAERLKASAAAAENVTLDPLASAEDIAAARARAADAAFEMRRLAVAQERLAGKLAEAQAAEQAERNGALYDAALKERDVLAADLAKVYPKAATQIADLLRRLDASDAAITEANKVRPRGSDPLFPAEIVARGNLEPVALGSPQTFRLSQTVKLPGLTRSATPFWEPRW